MSRKITILSVLLVAVVFAYGFASAAEKLLLAGGAYSVVVPEGWETASDTLRQSVTLSDPGAPDCALVLSAPDPVLNASQKVALLLASLSKEGVTAEIIGAGNDTAGGLPRFTAHIAAPWGEDEALIGVTEVITIDGCAVMMTATAPDSRFDAFAAKAEDVMASAEFAPSAVAENREYYRAVAEQLRTEAVNRLSTSAATRKRLLDSLDALDGSSGAK